MSLTLGIALFNATISLCGVIAAAVASWVSLSNRAALTQLRLDLRDREEEREEKLEARFAKLAEDTYRRFVVKA